MGPRNDDHDRHDSGAVGQVAVEDSRSQSQGSATVGSRDLSRVASVMVKVALRLLARSSTGEEP